MSPSGAPGRRSIEQSIDSGGRGRRRAGVGRALSCAIAVGRALGAAFPWGTLIINIVGSFLIGVFVESFALAWSTSQMVRVFLTVGICGGFTTFSTFSLDAIVLMQRGELWSAAAYIIASVALSILALYVGLQLVRALA